MSQMYEINVDGGLFLLFPVTKHKPIRKSKMCQNLPGST